MSTYEAAVLSWVDHLRAGGTTPWSEFEPAGPNRRGEVPGAAQLELVRRLAERWRGPGFERLADRVLQREAPGRGLPRLEVDHPAASHEVRAVDPAEVPVEELLRLGSGVLADLAIAAPTEARPTAKARRRPVMLGAPITRFSYADRHRGVVVVSPTLDQLMTEVWSTRVQLGAGARWRRFVELWAGRDQLPLSANAARLAAQAAKRVGLENVRVLVGSAARLPAPESTPPGEPTSLTAESVDLLRRVNPLLGVRLREHERDQARANAVRLLGGGHFLPLPIPAAHRDWANRRAQRIAEQLTEGGYAVHGDLGEFVAGLRGRPMYQEDVLDRLVDVVVRTMQEGVR